MNKEIYKKIKNNIDNLSKPLDGLGVFEDMIAKMGAILEDEEVRIDKSALLVFISDNGIIEEGVSQSSEEVTLLVARQLGLHNTSVCHMAEEAGVDVFPYDIGIKLSVRINGVDSDYHISNGTHNFLKQPAMTVEECRQAVAVGRKLARTYMEKGYKTLLLGEMGIGNTTTSAAIIASILGLKSVEICGRGAGLSDAGLARKIYVIDEAIDKYSLYNKDPMEVLRTVGGFDIAAMVGVMLEAAASNCEFFTDYDFNDIILDSNENIIKYDKENLLNSKENRIKAVHIPVILDGLITAAAALIAVRIDPKVKEVIFLSHNGREKGIKEVADELNMKPVIHADLALGEGTGAVMLMQLLKCPLAVYHASSTFAQSNIEAYRRFT